MVFFFFFFYRERERRRDWVWLLRCQIHGPRADDGLVVGRPDGGQVPQHFALCLLCVESGEISGSGWSGWDSDYQQKKKDNYYKSGFDFLYGESGAYWKKKNRPVDKPI